MSNKETPDCLKEAAEKKYPVKEHLIRDIQTESGFVRVDPNKEKREIWIAGATSPEAARYHQSPVAERDEILKPEVITEIIDHSPNPENEILELFKQWHNKLSQPSHEGKDADVKIKQLLTLTDEFIFPAYYSHEGKVMWKIVNVYTKFKQETLILCGVDDGISLALDLAIQEIKKRKESFYTESLKQKQ